MTGATPAADFFAQLSDHVGFLALKTFRADAGQDGLSAALLGLREGNGVVGLATAVDFLQYDFAVVGR